MTYLVAYVSAIALNFPMDDVKTDHLMVKQQNPYKTTSGRTDKSTQLLTPFSGTECFTLPSHSVLCFVMTISSWNHLLMLLEILLLQLISIFHLKISRAKTANKMDHNMWKDMKRCQKIVWNFVYIFVSSHLCHWKKMCRPFWTHLSGRPFRFHDFSRGTKNYLEPRVLSLH